VQITAVEIVLANDKDERLKAYCSITLDDSFVIRDMKVIHGIKGFFVAMPQRKLTDRCPSCSAKNNVTSSLCGQCGCRLPEMRQPIDMETGRYRTHGDTAHPINQRCREMIENAVLDAYAEELAMADVRDYVLERVA
jgi:stage V sporulation protein G